jgi:iron(III) transport system permease protein
MHLPIRRHIKKLRFLTNGWVIGAFATSLLVALPLLVIFPEVFVEGDETWRHILQRLIPTYVLNTIMLMAGVALLTFLMGVSTAWVVTMYDFQGRRFFQWALILPISIPAYILGFTWAGILDYTSPVYVFLRNNFGVETGPYLLFNILSMPGAILVLSLSLYPYVFLITRAYFLKQSTTLLEVAASLGRKPLNIFFSTALPLARPAIVAGISLALMEVLNDYGLARYYGVDTFTTGIFTAWFAFGNASAAMKLSAYLMVFVLALILLERYQRGQMRYDIVGSQYRPASARRLHGPALYGALALCLLPLLPGFLIPASMLIYWSLQTASQVLDFRFWELMRNSFLLAAAASALVVAVSLFIRFTVRSYPSRIVKVLARTATLGYALPGAVVAIGIMLPFLWMDGRLATALPGLRIVLSGTWIALVYAYMVRFMAVGYNSMDSGMARLSLSLDEASRSLGQSNINTLRRVILPLMKAPVLSAALLVFIDVLKELPLTLILRPFNFDTLAIRAFEYASDERVAEAAPAALIIVLIGIVPAFLLNRMIRGTGGSSERDQKTVLRQTGSGVKGAIGKGD